MFIIIFLFFPQIIVILIVIKLKKPNYYKLLLLYNVTKIYYTFCQKYFSRLIQGDFKKMEICFLRYNPLFMLDLNLKR